MPHTPSENLKQLGLYLDGWADLIPNRGDIVDEVRAELGDILKARNMPGADIWELDAAAGLSGGKRAYHAATNHPGFTTTVYVGNRGTDLYVSWRSFLKPVLNTSLLIILAVVAGVLGYLIAGTRQTGGGFFTEARTVFTPIMWMAATIVIFLLGVFIVAAISQVLRGNRTELFFIEPSWFNAEDVVATNLATHYSLLAALEKTGIEKDFLRDKKDFNAGRRDLRI